MYEPVFTEEALRSYRRADSPLARKIDRCVQNLRRNPYSHPKIKRLTGTLRGRFRYRVGDWRVVYRVDEQEKRVTILVIAHRSSVYE